MSEPRHPSGSWVFHNEKTATYDTPDGTAVPEELIQSARCLLDVFHICDVRAEQRAAIAAANSVKAQS